MSKLWYNFITSSNIAGCVPDRKPKRCTMVPMKTVLSLLFSVGSCNPLGSACHLAVLLAALLKSIMFLPFSSPSRITQALWGNVLLTYTPARVHVYTGETHQAITVGCTRFVTVLSSWACGSQRQVCRSERIFRLWKLRYCSHQRKDLSSYARGVKAAGGSSDCCRNSSDGLLPFAIFVTSCILSDCKH